MQAIGTFRRELKRDQEPSDMSDDDRSCEEGEVNVDKLLDDVRRVAASFPKFPSLLRRMRMYQK